MRNPFANAFEGVDVLGADGGVPIFTDAETIKIVQSALMALPQYKTDPLLSLAPYGADGKWGKTTARAVGRFNDYYRAGGNLAESDGTSITQGTLDALKLSPVAAPSGFRGPPLVLDVPKAGAPRVTVTDTPAGPRVVSTVETKMSDAELAADRAAADQAARDAKAAADRAAQSAAAAAQNPSDAAAKAKAQVDAAKASLAGKRAEDLAARLPERGIFDMIKAAPPWALAVGGIGVAGTLFGLGYAIFGGRGRS